MSKGFIDSYRFGQNLREISLNLKPCTNNSGEHVSDLVEALRSANSLSVMNISITSCACLQVAVDFSSWPSLRDLTLTFCDCMALTKLSLANVGNINLLYFKLSSISTSRLRLVTIYLQSQGH
eukprot:TRINITY_DN26358_c0_g1_i1.p1 TRINITY_DN26358_c0_g1~~TRINITY_DN26358_c0_g1_i1.p1  ORF type:complete len:123 (-),score=0.84 TRINITY_DN26358_c0_g1_i1:226-594(-)